MDDKRLSLRRWLSQWGPSHELPNWLDELQVGDSAEAQPGSRSPVWRLDKRTTRVEFYGALETELARLAEQQLGGVGSLIDPTALEVKRLVELADKSISSFYGTFATNWRLDSLPDEPVNVLIAEAREFSFLPYYQAFDTWVGSPSAGAGPGGPTVEGGASRASGEAADPASADSFRPRVDREFAWVLLRLVALWAVNNRVLLSAYPLRPPGLAVLIANYITRNASADRTALVSAAAADRAVRALGSLLNVATHPDTYKVGARGIAVLARGEAFAQLGFEPPDEGALRVNTANYAIQDLLISKRPFDATPGSTDWLIRRLTKQRSEACT